MRDIDIMTFSELFSACGAEGLGASWEPVPAPDGSTAVLLRTSGGEASLWQLWPAARMLANILSGRPLGFGCDGLSGWAAG